MNINRELVLGYAPVRRDVFPDPKDAVAQRDPIRKRVEGMIERIGNIRLVDIDWLNEEKLLVEHEDVKRVVKHFQNEGVDALFIPHCNFGQEEAVGQLAKALNVPVLLWGPRDVTPPEYLPRPTDTQCGLFASGKALRRYGVPFTYIENCWLDSPILDEGFENFIRVANVVRCFRGMRIGQICVRPWQFLTVKVNESELLEKFGIEVEPINSVEILGMIDDALANRKDEIAEVVKGFTGRCDCCSQTQDFMEKMAALQIAFLDLVKKYDLTGIATECWDLFEKTYGVRTCVIMGNLSEMGIPVVCETDIHGVIGAALGLAAARGDSPMFLADITQRHPTNDNAELLWHCGPFPRSLAKESCNPALVSWHGQWQLKDGDITLCRFDMIESGRYALFADHCHTTDGPVTHGTYVWVETDDWAKWERKFVEGPYIHHVAGLYGKYAPVLREACKYMNGVIYDCADKEIF